MTVKALYLSDRLAVDRQVPENQSSEHVLTKQCHYELPIKGVWWLLQFTLYFLGYEKKEDIPDDPAERVSSELKFSVAEWPVEVPLQLTGRQIISQTLVLTACLLHNIG